MTDIPLTNNKFLTIKGDVRIGFILIGLAVIPFFIPLIIFQYIGASSFPIGLIILCQALCKYSEDDKQNPRKESKV